MGTKKAMAVIAIVAGLVAGGVAVYDAVTAKERVLDEAASRWRAAPGCPRPRRERCWIKPWLPGK
jgi:hypothetical protein